MKLLAAAFLALVSLITITPYVRADNIGLTLKTGAATDLLVETPILNGEQFTYTHETLGILTNGNLLNSSTSVFTATYVDVLGTLGVFNFTDLCATVTIIGPAVPCQQFAFSFTNLTLGDASITADLAASININLGLASGSVGGLNLAPDGFNLVGASLGLGSGQIDFSNPPPNGGGDSPVPEPGTLSLMATGLLGAAGVIRRRFNKK